MVWAIPITADDAPVTYPLSVLLPATSSGLTIDTMVQVMRGIALVQAAELGEQIGRVDPDTMTRVDAAIVQLYGLRDVTVDATS